jgi:predicted ATP-grasp superfamily ATP-dependent carboligase
VLFPVGGVKDVGALQKEFERETAVLVGDPTVHQTLEDKGCVYNLCEQHGIPHPRVLAADPEELAAQLHDTDDGSPLAVIKPRRDIGAGQGLVFVNHRRELEGLPDLWRRLTARYGALIATEFIPGPVDAQLAIQLMFDRDSELIEFFVLRKLRQWPPKSGITAAAISTHELGLVSQMLPLFQQVRWRGPAEVELKRDSRTGAVCVLEINPRFSGTVAFPLSAGVDLPASMVKASVGQSRPRALTPYYAAGLHYWNPWPYTRSVLTDFSRPGRLRESLRSLVMPFIRRPAGNPYAWRDPAATIGKVLLEVTDALRRR